MEISNRCQKLYRVLKSRKRERPDENEEEPIEGEDYKKDDKHFVYRHA